MGRTFDNFAIMAAAKLTPCIQNIFRDALPSKPTVQIIEVKPVSTATGEAPTRIKCAAAPRLVALVLQPVIAQE